MKKILSFILITLFVFTSCKKEENVESAVNATSVADIQRIILEGYWQGDRISEKDQPIKDYEYFQVYKFNNNTQYDQYYSKATKYNDSPWYYRLKAGEDGKPIIVFYASESNFEDELFEDYAVYEVSVVDGDLFMYSKFYNETYIFKKYKSISDVKNLPTGL